MNDLCADLLAEYEELAALAETLTPEQWMTKTQFYGWTPWDEIAHLCFFDETALLAVTDAPAFAADAARLKEKTSSGMEISAIAREKYRDLPGAKLLPVWRERFRALVAALAEKDPKDRLPWYGPTMSARSFVTARMMETWAHGQDVFDMLGRPRQPSRRLKHIAHIGVTTFGWTFVNRGLTPPETAPYVELQAPGGEVWTWNDPDAAEYVKGDALDFCLLVTQRRHVDDTGLASAGEGTRRWLSMAQCFAGPPADGPAPGTRVPKAAVPA
jgi:uncharacterized protein (TIGR03084 family)